MPDFHQGFDPMGLVIDWLDACKERRLSSLIDLYDESATLDCCCEGKALRGLPNLEAYWGPKLVHAVSGAFDIDALFPETDGVCLDFRALRRCEYIFSSLTAEKFGTRLRTGGAGCLDLMPP